MKVKHLNQPMGLKPKNRMTMRWKGRKDNDQAIWRGAEEDCELREGTCFLIYKDSRMSKEDSFTV